jgi:diguanylate cyclase (GGDEF)-like protein
MTEPTDPHHHELVLTASEVVRIDSQVGRSDSEVVISAREVSRTTIEPAPTSAEAAPTPSEVMPRSGKQATPSSRAPPLSSLAAPPASDAIRNHSEIVRTDPERGKSDSEEPRSDSAEPRSDSAEPGSDSAEPGSDSAEPHSNGEIAKSTSELAQEARADLTQLHRHVVEAEDRVVATNAAQLLEANEHLAISSMRAQSEAETAAMALKKVRRSSELDSLTQLPNRALLLDRFGQAIANARRNSTWLALLFLDLDNFKHINDTLGHAMGDEVLKLAARCLVSSIRTGDTVSRHGGDEFLILLTGMSQATDAILVADKVVAALGTSTRVGNHVLRLKASIGISVYPDDGVDPDMLIDRADAAMYLAKKYRLGSFVFHGQEPKSEWKVPGSKRRRSQS